MRKLRGITRELPWNYRGTTVEWRCYDVGGYVNEMLCDDVYDDALFRGFSEAFDVAMCVGLAV